MNKITVAPAAALFWLCGLMAALGQPSTFPAKVEQPWAAQGRLASPISVTGSSAATALPATGLVAWLCNTGSVDAYVTFGSSNLVTTSTTTGSLLKANTCAAYDLYPAFGALTAPYTFVALIGASSGSTTVTVETGAGQPPQGPGATAVVPGVLPFPVTGSYFTNVAGSTLTRTTTTGTYTANTTVCATGGCVAGTVAIANANGGKGLINRVSMLKSGSTTVSAQFTIWFFSAAPVLTTPTQNDNVAYTGPRAADMPNYIGSAVCNSPTATSDTSAEVWYDCTLSNPNTAGVLDFQALSGSLNIDWLLSVNAAYVQTSGETFAPYVSGIY